MGAEEGRGIGMRLGAKQLRGKGPERTIRGRGRLATDLRRQEMEGAGGASSALGDNRRTDGSKRQ